MSCVSLYVVKFATGCYRYNSGGGGGGLISRAWHRWADCLIFVRKIIKWAQGINKVIRKADCAAQLYYKLLTT